MLVTTKGRYAMRLMTYLAAHSDRKTSLREVAENEDISLKYLEQLVRDLVNAKLLRSVRGHGGGYLLARDASAINAGDILRAAEGGSSTVGCLVLANNGTCPREDICTTLDFWAGLDKAVEEYVDGVMLSDLVKPK